MVSVPNVTLETEQAAMDKLRALVSDAETELNAPMMREVGGDVALYLETCAHILGGATDVIAYARVKRPLHSPQASVFWGK